MITQLVFSMGVKSSNLGIHCLMWQHVSRDAIEAALRSGMDPAELKRLIDEAAAAVRPSAGGQGAAQPGPGAAPPTASPWQQASGARRRGRPALARKSPFDGAAPRHVPHVAVEDSATHSALYMQLVVCDGLGPGFGFLVTVLLLMAGPFGCRSRRQVEKASPAVEPMTAAEIEAAARKLGKQPEEWLQDARDRGVLVTPDKS